MSLQFNSQLILYIGIFPLCKQPSSSGHIFSELLGYLHHCLRSTERFLLCTLERGLMRCPLLSPLTIQVAAMPLGIV